MTRTYNRRTILATIGAAGALTVGSGVVGGRSPPYTKYTYAQTGAEGLRVSVAWYERYNGEFLEAQNDSTETNATTVTDPHQPPFYVPETTGPILTLANVLPGDSGAVLVGLLAEQVPETLEGADLWFRPVLTGNEENGVTEPELKHGDEDDVSENGSGELADALTVQLFIDDGLVGGCDGRYGVFDSAIIDQTSLRNAFVSLESGVKLTDSCLNAGDHRCLGLAWELPAATGNVVQTDSVSFDLEFVGVGCGSENPWGGSP
ncbi:MAG: hypothetical protein ACOCY7_02200 [Halodesulfurarchaeum sp.]